MFLKKLLGKKPPEKISTEAPPPPEPTAAERLEKAVTDYARQEENRKKSTAEDQTRKADEEKQAVQDFRARKDDVILPVFEETIALFAKHGGQAHIGKSSDEAWEGESVRLNLFSRAEFRGPFIRFSLPDKRRRTVKVTKTLVDSAARDVSLDGLDAETVRREIAEFIEQVRQLK